LSRKKQGSNREYKPKDRLNPLYGEISHNALGSPTKYLTMAKASDIVVFDNLNVKEIQAFYGPMVNDNVMGVITNITQYQVTH
jgi:putative transposase